MNQKTNYKQTFSFSPVLWVPFAGVGIPGGGVDIYRKNRIISISIEIEYLH
jgi:hypothetical protein